MLGKGKHKKQKPVKQKKQKPPKVDFNATAKDQKEHDKIMKERERKIKKREAEERADLRKRNKAMRKGLGHETSLKYRTKNKSKVSILNNMLIHNGEVTAYFILKSFNYDVADPNSIESHISSLYNSISTVDSTLGKVQLSIFNIKNIVSKREVIREMVETVKLYKTGYNDIDEEYRDLISSIREDFTILAVKIDTSKHVDIETQSVKEIIKSSINSYFANNFSTKIQDVNETVLMQQDKKLIDILEIGAVPVSEKLVLNIYLNSLFPDYNIIYSNFIMNHASEIIGGIKQDIVPHLGYFELSNLGIATVGATPQKTFGSILTILKLPDSIESKVFNMNIPNMVVNLRLKPKEKVELEFRRMRADTKSEYHDAATIGDEDSQAGKDWDDINDAIAAIRAGRILADADCQILITADTKEALDTKRANVISILADMDVLASIAPKQAETFFKSFVRHDPIDYYHTGDLEYFLSFNQDHGVIVGDGDNDQFYAPTIGESSY